MLIHFRLNPSLTEEAIKDDNRHNLIVQGFVEKENKIIILLTADSSTVIVPFIAFKENALFKPNFDEPSIIDSGLTLKLGEYEADASALIKEFGNP